MATSLKAQLDVTLNWTLSTTPTGYTSAVPATNQFQFSDTITNGTGAADTADMLYATKLTIAASGNSTVNLSSTPTPDPFGVSIVMARIKYFFVNLLTTTSASSIAFGNATNPVVNWISSATATVKILNGGIFLLGSGGATGYAVTGTTADVIKVLNNDGVNVATVNIAIMGSSA